MANRALAGAKTYAATSARGTAVTTGALAANTWFEIKAVASSGSALPLEDVGKVFKSPDTTATAITLGSGDEVYPLTITKICKTDAEVSFEEGVIDVTDDCEAGFTAEILDGYKKISGSVNGFIKFNDDTGSLESVSESVFGRFINKVTDDGEGVYVETEAENEQLIFFILLNKNAAIGDVQNWLILPVVFTGFGTGAGLKDAQKRDLTWTKAQGFASLYERTAFAADVI